MIHGILNVYKEKGYTSHDVVAKLRGITGQRKIGHTGTLDPEAEGVLPVCLGRATKLCDMLTDKDKCYEAVMLLGVETDTEDMTGRILRTSDVTQVAEGDIREAVSGFVGEYAQIPPMYSALKVDGRRLYELAREGKTVERRARKVAVYSIDILDICIPEVRMRVHCSKGTYIRTLCRDIGEKLGCGACMQELVRTRAGAFMLEDSLTLAELEKRRQNGGLEEVVIPIDRMFADCPRVTVKKEWEKHAYNGNPVPREGICEEAALESQGQARMYDSRDQFIGIYRYEETQGEFEVVKMFYLRERD